MQTDSKKPFISSREHRYFLLTFLLLAIIGPLIDGSIGLKPFSLSGVTIPLGFALGTIYWLWWSIDTISWIRKKPEQFFENVRPKRVAWYSSRFFSKKENIIWFYSWISIFYFFLALFSLFITLAIVISRFR
jgi:hypothetical protein